MGSVKDLMILEEATHEKYGIGRFIYSDRYSVFDWGEMPDLIPNKGSAIAILGAYFFEKLIETGISTHYIGLVENNEVKKLNELENPSNIMQINLLRVIKPEQKKDKYDYSVYKKTKGNYLIPLEIIYRNSLPPGSSVFRRLKNGEIIPQDLGLDGMPEPNLKLENPILDVSTKLEITDRYLNWEEAKEISGLTDGEITTLKELTIKVNKLISEEFSRIGLINEDGKIETGFDNDKNIILVDVLGTLDECRFTFEGLPVSKEIARIYYRKTEWYNAVEEAKEKDRQNWKSICRLKPEPLPTELKNLISQIYISCTNQITKREWFRNVPQLADIIKVIKNKFL